MTAPILMTLTVCERCGNSFRSPWTTCGSCSSVEARQARVNEFLRFRDDATPLIAVHVDDYGDSLLAWDGARFFSVRDAHWVMRGGDHRAREDVIADNTKLRDELRDVLADNARLRRELEKRGRR